MKGCGVLASFAAGRSASQRPSFERAPAGSAWGPQTETPSGGEGKWRRNALILLVGAQGLEPWAR